MAIKVYLKRGNTNYKEKRLVDEISKAIDERLAKDPNFTFTPAETQADLEKMYVEYCTETVDFTEVNPGDKTTKTESTENAHNEFRADVNETLEKNATGSKETPSENVVDPFNRTAPNIRDYVKGADYPDDKKIDPNNPNPKSNFAEPNNFKQSFTMPSADDEKGSGQNSDPNNNNPAPEKKSKETKPVNPAWDGMDEAQKKKQTKRFAKSIVRLVSGLFEKGIIFWGTKDIHDAKLQELELTGEIDFNLVVSLDEDQETTIRNFFKAQEQAITQLAVVTEDERDRLTDSLAEVLMEKGIAPSNGQMLIIDVIEVFGIKTLGAWTIQRKNMELLNQLRLLTQQRNVGNGHNQNHETHHTTHQETTTTTTETTTETTDDTKIENPAETGLTTTE